VPPHCVNSRGLGRHREGVPTWTILLARFRALCAGCVSRSGRVRGFVATTHAGAPIAGAALRRLIIVGLASVVGSWVSVVMPRRGIAPGRVFPRSLVSMDDPLHLSFTSGLRLLAPIFRLPIPRFTVGHHNRGRVFLSRVRACGAVTVLRSSTSWRPDIARAPAVARLASLAADASGCRRRFAEPSMNATAGCASFATIRLIQTSASLTFGARRSTTSFASRGVRNPTTRRGISVLRIGGATRSVVTSGSTMKTY